MPSLYETFRDSRCYIWCCKEILNGIICLISSSQVAMTSVTNFPCLLMSNFQYTVFFLNIFDTEVMAVNMYFFFFFFEFSQESYFFISLLLSVHYQFLFSNCSWCYFFKKSKFEVTIPFIMSWVKVQFVHYMTGENSWKIVKNSWKTPGICLVKMSGHPDMCFPVNSSEQL